MDKLKFLDRKLKLYFFWITLERFPNLFRPSSKPYISGDSLRKYADHIFDESKTFIPKNVKNNDVIFLSGNLVNVFFKYFHPKINSKYLLITHNSDKNITESEASYVDEKIIHWFAQNLEYESNNKISLIPIGLENLRRLKFGRKIWFNNLYEKNSMVLFGFNLNTNYLKRSAAKNILSEFLNFKTYDNTKEYFYKLKSSKFIISPEGNGNDTHRIWEGLICNTFPIMINSKFSNNLLKLGVPGIYLENWEELRFYSKEDLDEIYNNEVKKSYSHLTYLNYWIDKIESYKLK